MEDYQNEQKNLKKSIDARYRDHINGLMLIRFRIIVPIGMVMCLSFFVIDRIVYPSSALVLLKIRCIDALILLFLIVLSFWKKIKPHISWLTNITGSVFILSTLIMISLTDGSSSRYYEGNNLLFLGYGIINCFYISHAICAFLIWIGLYEIAILVGAHGPFNLLNFGFANYFMASTAIFIVLMIKYYREQHYKAFVREAQLKINEETLAALYSQADKLAKTDTLTEINNRRNFSDMLQKKIEASEESKVTFWLVIFDVDFFKQVNDTYGHAFGDNVLVKVVGVVKNNVRSHDFIGRFGGDEFVVCLDFPTREGIINRLTKISNGVKTLELTHDGKNVPISISIGAAQFKPGIHMTEDKLMEMADFELFNVKKTNRGQISIGD